MMRSTTLRKWRGAQRWFAPLAGLLLVIVRGAARVSVTGRLALALLGCAACTNEDGGQPQSPVEISVDAGDHERDAEMPPMAATDGSTGSTGPSGAAGAPPERRDAGAPHAPEDAGHARDAGHASPPLDAGSPETDAGSDGAVAVMEEPPPCPAPEDPAYESSETRCDGIDNDCDGVVDVLLPLEHNRCDNPSGTCGEGHYSCHEGTRVCLASGPADEVLDGVDNDCDGEVDETTKTAMIHPRALLLVPTYLEREAGADTDNLASFLDQWGVPYDRPAQDEGFDDQLEHLADYTLVIVSSYLEGAFLSEWRASLLREFVEQGGILVVFKPVLAPEDPGSALLGLMGTEGTRDLERLSFDATPMGATRVFDTPEERSVPLQGVTEAETPVSWILHAAPDTQIGAYGFIGDQMIGPLLTRRSLGYGAIYALGHDLHSFWHTRCYVNCFEPSSDLTGLFLREALRESAGGHLVLKHTVPSTQDSLVILSHDVDAPDAQNPGPIWGKPGAEQVAELELSYGARGSYFITTDYINDYYSPQLLVRLCDLGMCPAGVHSVRHGADLPMSPVGDCMETRATYRDPQTLCGEVRVPLQIVEEDCGHRPLSWRSPFLYIHPDLYDILESQGILFDSSYAVGDLKFNLPLSLAHISINELRFRRRALYSMPLSLEDGIGDIVEGKETRQEMSAANARRFETMWSYTMLGNAANGAHTMVLLHPSYGLDVPEDNLKNKLVVEEAFLQACLERDVKLDATAEDLVVFWRAREDTALDATYKNGNYQGTLQVGQYPVRDLTLEFGDEIADFACGSCGSVRIRGRRVQLTDELAAGSVHTFSASAGVSP